MCVPIAICIHVQASHPRLGKAFVKQQKLRYFTHLVASTRTDKCVVVCENVPAREVSVKVMATARVEFGSTGTLFAHKNAP